MSVDKGKKYDRQIRLWGEQGQASMEEANICLLNAGPTGTETLKNLVLGGIASFTVVDGTKVEAADLGNNFLVDLNGLGTSKAKCVCALLQELNESVSGSYVEETPEALLQSNPKFFSAFSLVIATQVSFATASILDAECRSFGVKFLYVRSYGLTGLLRPSLKEHCIVEARPDNMVDDLRLHDPWPELLEFAHSFNLSKADDMTHKHIPYAVILIQAIEEWKASHNGGMPTSRQERNDFKDFVRSKERLCAGGEENFQEAVKEAHKTWAPPSIPSEVYSIMSDSCATEITSDSSNFWIMVAGLKKFVEGNGVFPLEGSIPDMTALTELYLALQGIYQAKAQKDVTEIEGYVHATMKKIGRDMAALPRAEIKRFCKNARYLQVVRFNAIADELSDSSMSKLKALLASEDTANNATLYVLLAATDGFAKRHNRYPGSYSSELEEDEPTQLKQVASSMCSDIQFPGEIREDLVAEICRFGASELHAVAAVMGGMAAQEAIKLITEQFVPLNGTLMYNAMDCTTSVLKL